MKSIYLVITLLSCVSGILGFLGGAYVMSFNQDKALQDVYEFTNAITRDAYPKLGRDSNHYLNLLFLEVLKSDDPILKSDFQGLLTGNVIAYAAELRMAIKRSEEAGGDEFYKETLKDIEDLLELEPPQAEDK